MYPTRDMKPKFGLHEILTLEMHSSRLKLQNALCSICPIYFRLFGILFGYYSDLRITKLIYENT